MEYGIEPVTPYSPDRLSGYFDAFVQNTQTLHNADTWMPTLHCLRGQKGYLEELLSKTATTLNALRDRQTRNERVLSAHPMPRSKRKKIQQNKWRTGKTIRTCENEERVILDCLQVCENNIQTLEAIIHPVDLSWTSAEYVSNGDSDTASLDWNGWTVDSPISPFAKDRRHALTLDDVPPESVLPSGGRRPPPLPPPSASVPGLAAPPNSAFTNSSLSPQAVEFEPCVRYDQPRLAKELDKLTISGLLASKRMQAIQMRRFSDQAIGHLFRRLSSRARPTPPRKSQSWAGPGSGQAECRESMGKARRKRCYSV